VFYDHNNSILKCAIGSDPVKSGCFHCFKHNQAHMFLWLRDIQSLTG